MGKLMHSAFVRITGVNSPLIHTFLCVLIGDEFTVKPCSIPGEVCPLQAAAELTTLSIHSAWTNTPVRNNRAGFVEAKIPS